MKKRMYLMIALVVPFSLHAMDQPKFQDRMEFDASGGRVIVRSALWPDSKQSMVGIEQRLQVNADGNLRYEFEEQDERTKAYHRAYCAASGLYPFVDGEVIFTPEAAGWHCSKDQLHGTGAPLPAEPSSGAILADRVERGRFGNELVVRTSALDDLRGGVIHVEQRLERVGTANYRYRYEDQSEGTRKYHWAYCEALRMEPDQEGETTFEGASSAWVCGQTTGEKALDAVIATAPSGSVPSGTNFAAHGHVKFRSSQAGAARAFMVVDNRCRVDWVRNFGSAFSDQRFMGVACLAHDSRFLATRLDACVPRVCGYDTGTIAVRP